MRFSLILLQLLSIPLPLSSFIYKKPSISIINKKPSTSIILRKPLTAHNKSFQFDINNDNYYDDFKLYDYRLFTLNVCIIYICFNYISYLLNNSIY